MSEKQIRNFEELSSKYKSIFSNRIVRDFFQNTENIDLLLRALDGHEDSKRILEDNFRRHFFRIRFVKYLSSTINYSSIDYMRITQKRTYRNPLIFDSPVSYDGNLSTIGDLLMNQRELLIAEKVYSDPIKFQDSIKNEDLALAFSLLTHKQKLITTLYYAMCYQDNEIANLLGVSTQAVCKTRNMALKNLRLAMKEGR
ncbi:sigma-70 family RNA polymerase sigma factor [Paenibacillus lentus]|uniref:sigma-70 family RNA polymerase sigma factor n=1 Tax=Paenibacillus lentus TaxID=1338368 RepID=UPI00365F7AFE